MTSEYLEDDVGTGLKCHTFGSHALTTAKVQHRETCFVRIFPHSPQCPQKQATFNFC